MRSIGRGFLLFSGAIVIMSAIGFSIFLFANQQNDLGYLRDDIFRFALETSFYVVMGILFLGFFSFGAALAESLFARKIALWVFSVPILIFLSLLGAVIFLFIIGLYGVVMDTPAKSFVSDFPNNISTENFQVIAFFTFASVALGFVLQLFDIARRDRGIVN